ncbi:MAG: trehalase family glycosidase [Armatimonadota bacterium]
MNNADISTSCTESIQPGEDKGFTERNYLANTQNSPVLAEKLFQLDAEIKGWWDADLHTASEEDVKNDAEGTLLFLPCPYISGGGGEKSFPEMYGWDVFFVNLALLIHGRLDIVRNHLINQMYMIEQYGMVLNGNRAFYLTRSQPPLHPETIRRYAERTPALDLIKNGYPLFEKEYGEYWGAEHHSTPIGLTTNNDLGDKSLRPELAAEAESGLDFCAMFDGDIRQCVPLITNCVLVSYARNLSWMAEQLGRQDEAQSWKQETQRRISLIRKYCWNEEDGFFLEYNYVRGEQINVWSICAYWTMWAGIATQQQAERLVSHLHRFERDGGIAITDKSYPSPHPEFAFLQWGYPTGWPPIQMMVVESLHKYGYHNDARRIAKKFLALVVDQYGRTGKLWEKYNILDCNVHLPFERYELPPMHGWTSGSVVFLSRYLDENPYIVES